MDVTSPNGAATAQIPVASLIIPVYNREDYLAQAIESVLHQTEPNLELIVIDDGSTDRSPQIAQHYAQRDRRVSFYHQANSGVAAALNAAIQHARAPYVGWVDSDDKLAPNALAVTAHILNRYRSVGLVYSNHGRIDAGGNALDMSNLRAVPYSRDRLLVDFMTFHFRLFRKTVFEQVGGLDSRYIPAEDYDFCLKVSEITDIYHVAQTLYFYRVHSENVSQIQRLKQIEASFQAAQAALQRRGLTQDYELCLAVKSTVSLRKKSNHEPR